MVKPDLRYCEKSTYLGEFIRPLIPIFDFQPCGAFMTGC